VLAADRQHQWSLAVLVRYVNVDLVLYTHTGQQQLTHTSIMIYDILFYSIYY